jgi:hypothetical protein
MQHESYQVTRRTVLGFAGAAVSVVVLGARTDAFADGGDRSIHHRQETHPYRICRRAVSLDRSSTLAWKSHFDGVPGFPVDGDGVLDDHRGLEAKLEAAGDGVMSVDAERHDFDRGLVEARGHGCLRDGEAVAEVAGVRCDEDAP